MNKLTGLKNNPIFLTILANALTDELRKSLQEQAALRVHCLIAESMLAGVAAHDLQSGKDLKQDQDQAKG